MEGHRFGDQPQIDFCYECRQDRHYRIEQRTIQRSFNGQWYAFYYTAAICTVCGAEISPPGLIDKNIEEFHDQCVEYKIVLEQ